MKSAAFHRHRVEPRTRVSLRAFDPAETTAFSGKKAAGEEALDRLRDRLAELQELLYAEHRHKVLIILQGMDTAGKDGVIRHVFGRINPQGVKVASFKTPTAEERDRDFLWRIHQSVPGKGEIGVFNRSHYEDVLIVRVHGLVPRETWKTRYEAINNFERILYREGTTILKFFLHISPKEQKERLQARLDDPKKRWKFNPSDLPERKRWGDYRRAYEDVLSRTSTAPAPWYIVPADKKWYRNLVVAAVLVETLDGLGMSYPEPDFEPSKIIIE